MAEPRHVVVTGAAAGIGLAIARQLAGQGWAVGLIDQSPQVEAAADDIARNTGAPMAWALADLADAAQIPPALATLQAALGPAAGLVNNAGIASHIAPVVRMQADLWARELAVNLTAPMLLSQALRPGMVAAGWGRIVHISSVNGEKGQAGQTNYSAAKAGMHGFTMALAQELAGKGVTVNTVSPGYIGTDMVKAIRPDVLEKIVATIPVKRLGRPEEIGSIVAWLAGEDSGFTTGADFSCNGGLHMG